MRQTFPAARALVLGRRDLRDAFDVLYEAGAVHTVESTRNLDVVARLVQRLLEKAPSAQGDHRQTVRARLPW